MEIKISWFEPAMKDQVVALFEKEYQTPEGYFAKLFDLFYYHPYQKNKCLMAVALHGEQVIGFQSFFYWPYTFKGKDFNTYQSGNSLIHPDYRGRGLFNQMLSFISKAIDGREVDFFVGFPTGASIKNFLKDKWNNPFNLHWWMKTINPAGFVSKNISNIKGISKGIKNLSNAYISEDQFNLKLSASFLEWRDLYSIHGRLFSYSFNNGKNEIVFHLKTNTRKKFISEIIVGHVQFSSAAAMDDLGVALHELVRKLQLSFCCHIITFASNEGNEKITTAFSKEGFKKLSKTIFFVVKTSNELPALLNNNSWQLYRSDIDTW